MPITAIMLHIRITGGCAISGGIHDGGYAEAEGVQAIPPVDVFIPGD